MSLNRLAPTPQSGDLDDELPPLDEPEGADADEGPALDELGDMLELQDEADVDMDDAEAADLDVGISLEQPDGTDEEGRGEIVLDIAELLSFDDAPSGSDGDGDADGLEGLDPAIGISEPAGSMLGDADEGVSDSFDQLIDEDLPGLDADAEGDFEEPIWAEADAFADDELPPPAARLWKTRRHAHDGLEALAASAQELFAADDGALFRVTAAAELEPVTQVDERLTSLAVSSVLCAWSRRGRLLTLDGSELVSQPGLFTAAGVAEGQLEHAELAAPTPSRLLALTRGDLFESRDGGRSFGRKREGNGVALARSGRALLDREAVLYSLDEGATFQSRALDGDAPAICRGDQLFVESRHDTVVIADTHRGLCVSKGGAAFERLPFASGVRALVIAELNTGPCLLAALSSGLDATISIVRHDLTSAQSDVVARIGPESGEDWPEESRVHAMLWHAGALWLTGALGLARIEPD